MRSNVRSLPAWHLELQVAATVWRRSKAVVLTSSRMLVACPDCRFCGDESSGRGSFSSLVR